MGLRFAVGAGQFEQHSFAGLEVAQHVDQRLPMGPG
jgi:hypothetical protein